MNRLIVTAAVDHRPKFYIYSYRCLINPMLIAKFFMTLLVE